MWCAVVSASIGYWDDGPALALGPFDSKDAAERAGLAYTDARPDRCGRYQTFTAVELVFERDG